MDLREKISKIQQEMKAPKNLYNKFGKYNYRNAEGILEAFKPFEELYKVFLIITDDVVEVGGRVYIKARATLCDCETSCEISVSAYAREAQDKKGMDDSQITGTASSYARKYALNGLLLLDDTKDADTDENRNEREARTLKQEDDKKTEDVSKQKIDETKQKAFLNFCDENKLDIYKILTSYHLSDVKDMTEGQHAAVKNHFEEYRDKWGAD